MRTRTNLPHRLFTALTTLGIITALLLVALPWQRSPVPIAAGASQAYPNRDGWPSQATTTPTLAPTLPPSTVAPSPATPTTPPASTVFVPATYKNWGAKWPHPVPTALTPAGPATPTPSLTTAPPAETATPTASPTTAPSPSPTPISPVEIVEQVGGVAYAAASSGDHVLVGRGNRIVVSNVSDPATPVEIGRTVPLSGVVQDVIVQDAVAYVLAVAGDRLNMAGVTSAVHAVDLDDVTQPALLSSVPLPGVAFEAAISSDRLYVGTLSGVGDAGDVAESTLHVLDIGRPDSVVETSRTSLSLAVFGMVLRHPYAYLVGQLEDGDAVLQVLDLSMRDDPRAVGELTVDNDSGSTVTTIHGDYLYFADDWSLHVVDVSSPDAPELVVNYWEWADYWDVARTYDLGFVGEHLAVLDYNRLKLLQPYDPDWQPDEGESALIGEAELDVRTVDFTRAIAVDGPRVVVAGGLTGGHVVVKATEPSSPEVLSTTIDVGDVMCGGAMDGTYTAMTEQGVRVVDLAGMRPATRGLLELDSRWWRCSAATAGNTAYFVGESFVIADVSDQSAPEALFQVVASPEWSATDVELLGNALYLATKQGGLRSANVTNPNAPTLGGTLPGCDNAVAVAQERDILAAANGSDGIALFDVSQPLNPRMLATSAVEGVSVDVALAGDAAYVLVHRGAGGGPPKAYVVEIDISQPESPVTLRETVLNTYATRLWRSLDLTMAATLQNLSLLDDESSPAGALALPEVARSLSEPASAAHIATGPGGLQILERRQ